MCVPKKAIYGKAFHFHQLAFRCVRGRAKIFCVLVYYFSVRYSARKRQLFLVSFRHRAVMSCENLDFESLSDTEFVRECLYLYLNNNPLRAIDLLEKRKEKSLITNYGHVFVHFVTSIISFNRGKLTEVSASLRELERRCTMEQPGWLASLKLKVFRNYIDWQTLLDELDRDVILADTLLCTTVLQILDSNYIKSILSIRRAFKIYTQTFKQINDLCNQYAVADEPSEVGE
jgi:hypothetical protein